MIEGNGVVEGAAAVRFDGVSGANADGDGHVVAVIDVVVRVEVVVPHGLGDAKDTGKGAPVAFDYVVRYGNELRHVGVGVGCFGSNADAYTRPSQVVEGAVFDVDLRGDRCQGGRHTPGR